MTTFNDDGARESEARPARAATRNGARARQTMRNDVTSAIICLLSFESRAKNVGTGQGEAKYAVRRG